MKYFKVYGLAVDENGDKTHIGVSVNVDFATAKMMAGIHNVPEADVTEITREEFERDYEQEGA